MTYTSTPVVKWTYNQDLIDFKDVDGFRIYNTQDQSLVADIKCVVREVDTFDALGNPICVELYECPGVKVQVPLQRYIDAPAATEVSLNVTAYNSREESPASSVLKVCWPQTISFDSTGEIGRNF